MCIVVDSSDGVIAARREARAQALRMGFTTADATLIATAVSELARNVLLHAGGGMVRIEIVHEPRSGIRITAVDCGPGVRDVPLALTAGRSSNGGLGLGLTAVQKAMDTFDLRTAEGRGTRVTVQKWL